MLLWQRAAALQQRCRAYARMTRSQQVPDILMPASCRHACSALCTQTTVLERSNAGLHTDAVRKWRACLICTIQQGDNVFRRAGFLPDAQRRRAKEDMRIQLKQEWLQEQEALKQRALTLRFSYWDGSGHQRQASVTVGDTVGDFLKQARAVLETDFPNLRHVTVPNLLLVKDDIMLPQATTFYAFLVGHAHNGRGKQLFDVDEAVDDQKMHSAKVVLRSWYESNKHIYPANRWELFDEMQHIKR